MLRYFTKGVLRYHFEMLRETVNISILFCEEISLPSEYGNVESMTRYEMIFKTVFLFGHCQLCHVQPLDFHYLQRATDRINKIFETN